MAQQKIRQVVTEVLGSLGTLLGLGWLLWWAEQFVLKPFLVAEVETGLTVADLMDMFEFSFYLIVLIAGGGILVWYGLSRWWFKVIHRHEAQKRLVWSIIGLVVLVACTACSLYTFQRAEEGWLLARSFLIFSGTLLYYITTVFFTPAAFKYIPLGASRLKPRFL